MPRSLIDLGAQPWQFGQAPRQPFSARPVDDRAVVQEWLPARVPGDIHDDLIAAGRLGAVESPAGAAAAAWVDDCDWWYRTQIAGDQLPGALAMLEADGIDYLSALWLDERLLATHAGMSDRQAVPLPRLGTASHELAVRVWGGGALPRMPNPPLRRLARRLYRLANPTGEYFPDRMATAKAQFSFGWDFAPHLLSAGIWDDIRVVITRHAYI